MKNSILAILSAPDAIPPNPKIAATIAIMINITVHFNIIFKIYWLVIVQKYREATVDFLELIVFNFALLKCVKE